jgi:hypothetical protein
MGVTVAAPVEATGVDRRVRIESFDPFELSPQMKRLRDAKSVTIAAMILGGIAAVVVSAIVTDHFGSISDVEPWNDALRLMQVGSPPPSRPDFPLMRDVVSWYLILMSALTLIIVRIQWRRITSIVPHLAREGAIEWRDTVAGSARSRRLLVGPDHADAAPSEFLSAALRRSQAWINGIGHFWYALWILAALVAAIFINGEVGGSFGALAPSHLTPAQHAVWLEHANASWWAAPKSIYGMLAYFVIAALMFAAIAAQNGVGLAAMFLFVAMRRTLNFRLDWDNCDGYNGWEPVASLHRYTLWVVTLHVAAITSVMWLMGWGRFAYMTILIVIPVVGIPLYLLFPACIFLQMGEREKRRRTKELSARLREETDRAAQLAIRDEIEAVRKARINPLRIRGRQVPASVATIIVPVILTVIQIVAALKT